jgi:hypothetical protein
MSNANDIARFHAAMTAANDRDLADRKSQAKLDAMMVSDLTDTERQAILDLAEGVVDIAADDARALRIAGLTSGRGDDLELTARGERIAGQLGADTTLLVSVD